MDLDALPVYFETIKSAAARGAAPAATGMANEFRAGVANVTLREVGHAPNQFWKAPAGRPPAYASGDLARSVRATPAYGAVKATAQVGAYVRYAAIQEVGGTTWPNTHRFMHWRNSFGPWWKRQVTVPAHPYFRPTVERQAASGELSRAARDAFWARIAPYMYY